MVVDQELNQIVSWSSLALRKSKKAIALDDKKENVQSKRKWEKYPKTFFSKSLILYA